MPHFATTNGARAAIMTDSSSTPSTQEPPSKKSRGSLLRQPVTGTTPKIPTWETVPLGMVKGRDREGGTKYSIRATRPTASAIKAGQVVGKHYNLIFVKDGHRTARTYEVTFTSAVNPAKVFRIRVVASSLRGLLFDVVREMGNLRATEVTTNFSIHFLAVSEKEGMTEEILDVPYAEELPNAHKPSTDEAVEPLVLED
jgi:hypothetical protein